MGCSTKLSKGLSRPSVIICLGILFLGLHATLVAASPLPDGDNGKTAQEHLDTATSTVKDFWDRTKNTFNGEKPGLTTWEIIGLAAAAVFIFCFFFCCIGFCLCECIKELVCCICCCGCCRD